MSLPCLIRANPMRAGKASVGSILAISRMSASTLDDALEAVLWVLS